MKKIALIVALVFTSACADTKVINGTKYDTYGLLNEDENKNPDIEYRLVWGNIVWGALLIETIAAPFYFFGFSIYEPVGPKNPNHVKGKIN